MNPQRERYIHLLQTHDWYYDYSDDYGVWAKGNTQRQEIEDLRRRVDPDYKIWNETVSEDHRVNVK